MNTSAKKTIAAAIDEVVALARRVVPPKMTAAVLYGSEDLRIEEIDVPSLAADEVLLRVRLALTDGTDLKVWKRGYHAKMIRPPGVFGQEVVGEVVAVGKRFDPRWRMGVRVVAANPHAPASVNTLAYGNHFADHFVPKHRGWTNHFGVITALPDFQVS